MGWRRNPERTAWVVLTTSFLACCLLAVALPLGVRAYLLESTRDRNIFVTALSGTVQVQPAGAADPVAVTDQRAFGEGSLIITDTASRALLTAYSDEGNQQVLASIQLQPDTAVEVQRVRTPRFSLSRRAHEVGIDLERGRAFVTTQPAEDRPVNAWVRTPEADILMATGTIDVIGNGDETQVRVRSGPVQVEAMGARVTVSAGERVTVPEGSQPGLPVPSALNLVLNGTFEGRISPPWEQVVEVPPGLPPGEITVQPAGQGQAVRFSRRAEDGAPNRVGVTQALNRDVQGYDALTLSFDLQLLYQSVPGGGYLATEYPIMVDIFYTDVYGKDLHWYQGFYYLDLPSGSTYLPPTGEKVPLGVWYAYESPNLFELLDDTRPARVNSITLYASGHDYDSLISNVALVVR